MRRMAFAVAALLGCFATPARADTLPLIEGLPGGYLPGQPFTFTLRVPFLPEFRSYTLELVFTTEVDPALVAFPTVAPTGSYVFPTSANFGFQFEAPPGFQEVRLTIFDSIAPDSVTAVPGQNDMLATITVSPGESLSGPIRLSIGPNTVFDYLTEINYPPPENAVIEQAPAPPGVALLALGGFLVVARTWFGRRAAKAS